MTHSKKLKVLIVSSEVSPYAKTGGLGDIMGDLPIELRRQSIDARVILPKYNHINKNNYKDMEYINSFTVQLGLNGYEASTFLLNKEQLIYALGNEFFFNRDEIYGYSDDFLRFAFFAKASLEFLRKIDFTPDIIHFNDWQVGLGSFYLKELYSKDYFYSNIKSLYTIHNIQYQGNFEKEVLGVLGIPEYYYNIDMLEFYNNISYMKAGILYSDAVSTVSENYAKEIQTASYGYSLEGVISKRKSQLYGIINGISYDNGLHKVVKNKTHLQKSLGLEVKDVPIISVISRLAQQKGMDIILESLDDILKKDVQVVILGTGDYKYESAFRDYANKYTEKLSVNILFETDVADSIYKNSDIFLMPSLFEPCGLSQMIAMKFGTVPVVRKTGGLADTVVHYNSKTKLGNGFLFEDYDAQGMLWALNEALSLYKDEEEWNRIVNNAFETRFSLSLTAKKYIELYNKVVDY